MKSQKYQITIDRKPLKGPQYNNLDWKQAEKMVKVVIKKPEVHRYKVINIEKQMR